MSEERPTVLGRRGSLVAVEDLPFLRQEIQQAERDVETEQPVVAETSKVHPALGVGNGPAKGGERGQRQGDYEARIAEAEVIDVDDAGERAVLGDDDILSGGVVEERGCRLLVGLRTQRAQDSFERIDEAEIEDTGGRDTTA